MKQIVKKISVVCMALSMFFLVAGFGLGSVEAQTVTPTPTTTMSPMPLTTPLTPTPAPTPIPALTPTTSSTPISVPLPVVTPLSSASTPTPTPSPSTPTAGYIQFNNLSVGSISGTIAPATIYALPPTQTVTGVVSNECTSYVSQSDTVGSTVSCPLPPGGATSTYTVNITNTTQLLLSDRTSAVLGNITPGDVVNAYGYYSGNGVIQAQVIRDLSKPIAPGTVTVPSIVTTPSTGTTGSVPSATTPVEPIVGTNPSEGQLLQILQTLMIQMQGILTQLVQMSGSPVSTGTGTASNGTTSANLAPMIPAASPTPSVSSTPASTPAPASTITP